MILNIICVFLFIYIIDVFSTKIINTKLNEWKNRFRHENEEKLRIKEENERKKLQINIEHLNRCENISDIFDTFIVRELKILCKYYDLPVSGNKSDLCNILSLRNRNKQSISTKRQDFFKDINCPICYDTQYKMVAMIPCGHTYCISCANKIGSCPICKNVHKTSRVKYVELYVQ